ncbi:Hematopoietic prostaglandin D synthase [Holothuria leucospilota]|uniref:glutathione transferase n=1 Tax=Holothuria leucospilota TaxID=206669 RepID=A0A9Q1HGK1_HOLLE|nr:Hematopoietic prostaglandin D synthase [Holothuria leucospilota]
MPRYKLIYFNARARAEVVRYMMELKDISYEDHRIQFEKWPELRPSKSLLFGRLITFLLYNLTG